MIAHSYAQDDVAVYDGFTQVFTAARPMSATVKNEAKLMEHPVESGAAVADHKVGQPVQIELSLMVAGGNYRDVYAEIKQLYEEGRLLVVQTRADSYDDQVIEALPHEEDPETFDALKIDLKTRQVRIVSAQIQVLPKKPAQQKTQQTGEKQPQQEKQQGSWAHGVFGKKRGSSK